ncbi:cell 5A endo-1,4-betaglucanase [Achlya hypogyna]|uniref:Cell 5A endo-1,4-betaglucanase n=1 Tax=Achlya hypogyna TaxID=1202772 RepID=A0A1V9ZGN2_ACHHY|nr:cell 5A endo-1,4-betaglucanase [Achlya hypogyna]
MDPSTADYAAIATPRETYRDAIEYGTTDGDADQQRCSSSNRRHVLGTVPEHSRQGPLRFRGRLVIWPGIVLLAVLGVVAAALMTKYAIDARESMFVRRDNYEAARRQSRAIRWNETTNNETIRAPTSTKELVSPDGVVGNPTVYPPSGCVLPNYVSKNGKLFAEGPNGESIQMAIKGINWSGMETSLGIPFGLWTNEYNGTTVYEIALFLSRNKVNSIRLPLSVSSILADTPPLKSVVNQAQNRALDISTYMSTIASLTRSLAYRNISVLLDLHTLTPTVNGGWPWSPGTPYTQAAFLEAVDALTAALCEDTFWNIIGVDVKNEPYLATWGDGGSTDFRLMAAIIGNRVLKGCSNWLVFVEGISSAQTLTVDNSTFSFFDWWGGGLEGAGTAPVDLAKPHKLVYSPHYYTPAVYPQLYFLQSGTKAGNVIRDFVELDDTTLRRRVFATSQHMFGYLAGTQDAVIIAGEFGGLYAQDLHPKKTTQRVTQYMIDVLKQPGFAGGYLWALNPESAYQYNPSDTEVTAFEGLLRPNWLDVNGPLLQAMAAMDAIPHVQPFPCFPKKA